MKDYGGGGEQLSSPFQLLFISTSTGVHFNWSLLLSQSMVMAIMCLKTDTDVQSVPTRDDGAAKIDPNKIIRKMYSALKRLWD